MGQGIGAVLPWNQVFDINFIIDNFDTGTALVTEFIPYFNQFLFDDIQLQFPAAQNINQTMDTGFNLVIFITDFLTFQTGQTAQTHADNGLCLIFIQMEFIFFLAIHNTQQCNLVDDERLCHQVLLGIGFIGGCTDDGNDTVNIIGGNLQAFQNMGTCFCLFQVKPAAAFNDFTLEFNVLVNQLPQVQRARLVIDQSQIVNGEGFLQLGIIEQLIEDNLRICVFFQFYNHTDAFPVGFITQVRNAFNSLILDQIRNGFHQPCLVDTIRDFGCHNTGSAMGHILKVGPGTHFQLAAAGGIGSTNAAAAHNQATSREIRALDVLTDFIQTCFRVVNDMADTVNDFGEVMGRHIGCHTDSNTGGAIDQHARETGRQYRRFLAVVIEVRHKLDGILVDIGHHMGSQLTHTGFRVTVSSRWVAIQRAKVAMTINHGIAQGKPLCHTHHGIINGGITMGMIPA